MWDASYEGCRGCKSSFLRLLWCAAAEGNGALWKFYAFPSFQFGQFSHSECKKWKRFNRSNSTILCPPTPFLTCQYHHIWQEIMGSLSSKGSGNVMFCHGLALLIQLLRQSVRGARGHLGHASLSKSGTEIYVEIFKNLQSRRYPAKCSQFFTLFRCASISSTYPCLSVRPLVILLYFHCRWTFLSYSRLWRQWVISSK